MIKFKPFLLLSLILSAFSSSSFADSFEIVPHCYEPSQPLWLATSYYKTRYNSDVEEYQRCMKAFITTQERAINIHTLAAQKALETWNDFAEKQ